jgi:hypothetical protein
MFHIATGWVKMMSFPQSRKTVFRFVAFALVILGWGFDSLPSWAEDLVGVTLPSSATIQFKNGTTRSGVRMEGFDGQVIKYSKGESSGSAKIKDIKTISFAGKYEIKAANVVVRGEGLKDCSEQDLIAIPANHFKIANRTQASINLSSLQAVQRKEISQMTQVRGLVIENLQFDDQGVIKIMSKACPAL